MLKKGGKFPEILLFWPTRIRNECTRHGGMERRRSPPSGAAGFPHTLLHTAECIQITLNPKCRRQIPDSGERQRVTRAPLLLALQPLQRFKVDVEIFIKHPSGVSWISNIPEVCVPPLSHSLQRSSRNIIFLWQTQLFFNCLAAFFFFFKHAVDFLLSGMLPTRTLKSLDFWVDWHKLWILTERRDLIKGNLNLSLSKPIAENEQQKPETIYNPTKAAEFKIKFSCFLLSCLQLQRFGTFIF